MAPSSMFASKKQRILALLSQPADTYSDASPKGSIDEPIRELIDQINAYKQLVTTSSCSGRISIFQEGSGSGGKGDKRGQEIGEKGQWLFVSHEPLAFPATASEGSSKPYFWHEQFGLSPKKHSTKCELEVELLPSATRLVHFKLEPMILHILCSSSVAADKVLKCAQQAGFRESGASNVPGDAETPVNVAIRTAGLGFDCIVGNTMDDAPTGEDVDRESSGKATCASLVSEEYLSLLVHNANEKFKTNFERMERLRTLLIDAFSEHCGSVWEDASARSERKRAEGLRRKEEMKGVTTVEPSNNVTDAHDDWLGLNILDEG